jgi:hypothetical protein
MEALRLWLDSYNDLYSDFDSRQYVRRRISEDFMNELRQALTGEYVAARELVLLLPEVHRQSETEEKIIERLHRHFQEKLKDAQYKHHKKVRAGWILIIAGLAVMVINAWLSIQYPEQKMLMASKVVLEPAGWFMMWTGLDILFSDRKILRKELLLFRSLSAMKIEFQTDRTA